MRRWVSNAGCGYAPSRMGLRMGPSRRGWTLAIGSAACLAAAGAGLAGCFGAGAPIERVVEEGPEEDDVASSAVGAGPDTGPGAGPIDPHGPDGIDPPHGSFAGGLRAVVRGAGFRQGTRVWVGDAEATDVVVLGPTRVQITTPPGPPGLADVTTELPDDPSTRRTLTDAYTYDAFHLEPSIGPPSGGIVTRIVGEATGWDGSTEARIGGAPCTSLEVIGPEELLCEVPPGTLGSKPVRIGPAGDDDGAITVLDAFTYDDAPEGAVGGLDGAPLDGRLEVRVLGAYTGEPLPGATVVVGEDLDTAIVAQTGGDGRAIVEDAGLDGPVTVTAALPCHQPTTFVDVGVERVTFYLDPILDIACIESIELPPPGGSGSGATKGTIAGALTWGTVGEFDRAPFAVPPPGPGERQVAYVFLAGSSPTSPFVLPPGASGITPDADGSIGFSFEMSASPGNRVLYALAGLEDRNVTPPRFVPWSMGVLRGVVILSGITTSDVVIEMRHPLEHALDIELAPPTPTPRGPDRVQVSTSIGLGTEGFLILPQGRTVRPLPLPGGALEVVGLPLLDGQLQGAAYEVHARAATGDDLLLPLSAVAGVSTTVADVVQLGDFVGVPRLVTPAPGTSWDGEHLDIELGPGSSVVDVVVLDVATAGELVRWKIAAPGDRRSVRVPDLRELGSGELGLGLPPGPIDVLVTVGRVDGLDWGQVQYRHLRSQNMDAHALDTFDARL